jgi:hypothetical protein
MHPCLEIYALFVFNHSLLRAFAHSDSKQINVQSSDSLRNHFLLEVKRLCLDRIVLRLASLNQQLHFVLSKVLVSHYMPLLVL